jgi:hypothetical protein
MGEITSRHGEEEEQKQSRKTAKIADACIRAPVRCRSAAPFDQGREETVGEGHEANGANAKASGITS